VQRYVCNDWFPLRRWLKKNKGYIYCRLQQNSKEISELGKFMKDQLQSGHDLYFVIQEENRGHEARQAFITPDVIERMIRTSHFKMNQINVELSNNLATTDILLRFGAEWAFSISRYVL